jgi:2-polyprenyl-3-methyl-5-hydroxy-6-metoxy-1,4-benzoquinol methylase
VRLPPSAVSPSFPKEGPTSPRKGNSKRAERKIIRTPTLLRNTAFEGLTTQERTWGVIMTFARTHEIIPNYQIIIMETKGYCVWYEPVKKLLSKNDKILELGCGSGAFLQELHDKGYHVTGADMAGNFMKRNFKIYKADLQCQKIPTSQKFDKIIIIETIEHLVNPYPMLRECKRLLALNGRLIISTHNQLNLFMRLYALAGKVNATNDVSRAYDRELPTVKDIPKNIREMETIDYEGVVGHLRVYSKSVLINTLKKENFRLQKDHSWFYLNGLLFNPPLPSLFSRHLLMEFKKVD